MFLVTLLLRSKSSMLYKTVDLDIEFQSNAASGSAGSTAAGPSTNSSKSASSLEKSLSELRREIR